MESALQRVCRLLGSSAVERLRPWFGRVAQMPGAKRIFRRISSSPVADQLCDYLAEMRYALVFAGLGFGVTIEPHGAEGPDLGIARDGCLHAVEVARFRRIYGGPSLVSPNDVPEVLPIYGDPHRDMQKVREKIRSKLRQVRTGPGIIALWNDDGDLEELEVHMAIEDLIDDAAGGLLALPRGLQFILYGSEFWNPRAQQQLYLFPVHGLPEKNEESWQHELASSTVACLIRRAIAQTAGPCD